MGFLSRYLSQPTLLSQMIFRSFLQQGMELSVNSGDWRARASSRSALGTSEVCCFRGHWPKPVSLTRHLITRSERCTRSRQPESMRKMSPLIRWGSFERSARNLSALYAQFAGGLSNNRTEPSYPLSCANTSPGLVWSHGCALGSGSSPPKPVATVSAVLAVGFSPEWRRFGLGLTGTKKFMVTRSCDRGYHCPDTRHLTPFLSPCIAG